MFNNIDCKLIQTNDSNFVFFRDFLSVYQIEDKIITDYINGELSQQDPICNVIEDEFTKANSKLLEISREGIQKVFFDSIVLIITRDCNLRCKYCYSVNSDINRDEMPFDIAQKAIDLLLRISPDRDEYRIVFFGGEPFLNFKLMQSIVTYAKNEITNKLGKRVNFGLTSNGTIINEKIISFIATESIALQISMDGSKDNHNRNRIFVNGSGSFDRIMKNAALLKAANIPFNFRPTFSVDTNIYNNIKLMEDLEIPFGFGFTLNTQEKSKEITDFRYSNWGEIRKSFVDVVNYFYTKILKGEIIYCTNIINSLYRIEGKLGKNTNCTSGISTLSILPDGSILPCQNFQNHSECIIGDLDEEFIKSSISATNVNEMLECNNCWAKFLCGGGCYFAKYEENGDFMNPVSSSCELTKLFWESMLELYSKLLKDDLLTSYLVNYDSSFRINA